MSNILLTGGHGYLGARLGEYLSKIGHTVTALGRSNTSINKEWVSMMKEVIIGDIRDKNLIQNLVKKEFDVIIHLISLDHNKSENNPNFVSSINVLPTWDLLESFSKFNLKKFIYFSTLQVYGIMPFIDIKEDYIPSPKNTYGLTHFLSENICNYYNDKTEINCINVRLSNSYGSPIFKENNCWWLVINDLCKSAYKNNRIKLLSDGSPQRDFIHISDVCKGIKILLNTDKKNLQNNTYHISSGQTLTILELAHSVKEIYKLRYNKNIPVLLPNKMVSESPDKYLETERYIINNSKLTSLGFSPETSLENGINEVFGYLEKSYD